MTNSLLVGKYIRKILDGNRTLHKMTKGQIRALVTLPDTKFPFITFKRGQIGKDSQTKDIYDTERVEVEVLCVSNDYEETITIANEVRKTLEKNDYEDEDITITEIELVSADEGFEDEAFYQNLVFQMLVD